MTKKNEDRVDWQVVCLAIRRHYKNLDATAKEIGSSWNHLNNLARGDVKETKYRTGCRLLRIYADICKKLNKQPEWTANSDEETILIMSPAEARINHQALRRPQALSTPKITRHTNMPVTSLSDLARKILNRSNA